MQLDEEDAQEEHEYEEDQPEAEDGFAGEAVDPSDAPNGTPDAADQDALADFWAEREQEPEQDQDPLGDFWESRDRKNSDEAEQLDDGDLESREALEEKLLAIRDASIACLEAKDGQTMLNKIGSDPVVKEQRKSFAGLSMFELIRGFPENFETEDRGNGQHLVTLRSIDPPDPQGLAALVDKCVNGNGRRKEQAKPASETYRSEPSGKMESYRKGEPYHRREPHNTEPPRQGHANPNTVVAGELSDGWKDRDEKTIYIGYVPPAVRSKLDIAEAFQRLGLRVAHIHVRTDRKFGFVHFETERDANAAIDVHTVEICGSRVEVKHGGGSSRKRARSPDRDYSRGPDRDFHREADRDPYRSADRREPDRSFHRGLDRDLHRGGNRDWGGDRDFRRGPDRDFHYGGDRDFHRAADHELRRGPDRDFLRGGGRDSQHRGFDREAHRDAGRRDFYRGAAFEGANAGLPRREGGDMPAPFSRRERDNDRGRLRSPIRSEPPRPGPARPIGMPDPKQAPGGFGPGPGRRMGRADAPPPRPTCAPHLGGSGPAPAAVGSQGGRGAPAPTSTPESKRERVGLPMPPDRGPH